MASEIGVQTIQHTNGTDALTIDSNGVVTKPVLPAWCVGITNVQSMSGAGTNHQNLDRSSGAQFFLQGGVTLSSNKVTVPVAGVYQVNLVLRFDGVGSNYYHITRIYKNTASTANELAYIINGNPAGDYENATGSVVAKLEANDTVWVSHYQEADTSYNINNTLKFSGVLIG